MGRSAERRKWAYAACAALINAALLGFFHDRYWYPTDDEFHATIAERLLAGEVLHRDIQDIRPPLIHFVHAGAFILFGMDLVSLRYPMVAVCFIGSLAWFLVLNRRNTVLAIVASMASIAVGVLYFLSPSSSWYCLALAGLLSWWLVATPAGPVRLVGAGVLIGTITLFRHLTGVWVAMAVISIVLLENRDAAATGKKALLGRLQAAVMLVAMAGYLVTNPETQPGGFITIAAWPLGLLIWMTLRLELSNAEVIRRVGLLLVGVLAVATPVLVFYVVNGALPMLIHDLTTVAGGELRLAFYGQGWFNVLGLGGLHQAVTSADPARAINGVYWAALAIAPLVNGVCTLTAVVRGDSGEGLVLPLLATFFALVALNFEGPLYLHYVVGLTLVSLLWIAAGSGKVVGALAGGLAVVLSLAGIIFHAAQSRERTALQILRGDRVTELSTLVPCALPRCSLRVSAADAEVFGAVVSVIQANSDPGESILALPYDAELYFLAQRRNPVRFYSAAQGIMTDEELVTVRSQLEAVRVVTFRPDDKYNTREVLALMEDVRRRFRQVAVVAGVEVYRREP